jgi:adenylate kinase family enzyme
MAAQHVMVIGPSGSGKSTVARTLAQAIEARWFPLDDLNYSIAPDASARVPQDLWEQELRRTLLKRPIVSDGLYVKSLALRAASADVVVLCDGSALGCVRNQILRALKQHLGREQAIHLSDTERNKVATRHSLRVQLLRTFNYFRYQRPQVLKFISRCLDHSRVVICLAGRRGADEFLDTLVASAGPSRRSIAVRTE